MLALALSIIPFPFAFLIILGALSDLSSFRIPNAVPYGLVVLFALRSILGWLNTPFLPSLSFHIPPYWIDVAISLGIALVVLIVSIIFWQRGYIGGGYAKYLAATSLWMGPIGVVQYMVILSALALVMALILKLSSRWGFLVHAGRLPAFVKRLFAKIEDNQLPYGFPIGIAALIMIPQIFKA
ncbi:MAG: prepilin peptidase [Aestuariivirga sp.]|uniref:A24 family peptidase n=1 Tax=Aestuariivirga sp. TaxID=2650926 RepID=UPI003019B16C